MASSTVAEAYERFMASHGALVRFLVRRAAKGTPSHLREDLEQAAAVGVVRGLAASGDVRQVAAAVATELNAVARPARRLADLEAELPADLEVPADELNAEELLHQGDCSFALFQLVLSLPVSERYVAEARFIADPPRTYQSIADELGITLGAARHLETRARAQLVELASAKGIVQH